MATTFATPKTWALGDVLTAAEMNLYVRDNTSWLGTDKPMVRVVRTTSQAVTSSVETPVIFDSQASPFYDNQNLWDAGTPDRFTIPAGMAGKYLMVGGLAFFALAGTSRIAFWRLGTTPGVGQIGRVSVTGSSITETQECTTIYDLVVGNTMQWTGYQDSGIGLAFLADGYASPLYGAMVWLGT
jgi:hypothetical protein